MELRHIGDWESRVQPGMRWAVPVTLSGPHHEADGESRMDFNAAAT